MCDGPQKKQETGKTTVKDFPFISQVILVDLSIKDLFVQVDVHF